jgi:UDP-glucose 4-epimerase
MTGDMGFIGTHFKKYLNQFPTIKVFTEDLKRGPKENILVSDAIKDIDVVFHFASQTSVQQSILDPISDATNNIIGTLRVLEKYPFKKIIYAGSVAGKDPKSPYGLSKRTSAEYIKMLYSDYVILNFPNIYGEGGNGVIDKFLKSDIININGDGKQTRTFIDVENLCLLIFNAIFLEKGEYDIGGETRDLNWIVNKFLQYYPQKRVYYVPEMHGEIRKSLIKNTYPDLYFKEGIENYIKKFINIY